MKCASAWLAACACTALACLPLPCAGQVGANVPGGAPAAEQPESGIPGRLRLQLRPRYTYVDQATKPNLAQAFNMRTLLGYRTAPVNDFSVTGELVDVRWLHPLRATNEPDRPPAKVSPYPLVADPEKSGVNLLFADYAGVPDTRIRFGRQAIKLDNERFVGDADMRQMPQVFDAVSVRNTSLPDTEIFAAHAWHVRNTFGNRVKTATTLFNVRTKLDAGPSVGGYAYFQDQPVTSTPTGFGDNSNRIVGARVEGTVLHPGAPELKWYYTAEVARQRPHASGDDRIQASYHRLAFGPSWSSYFAQIGYERLGSNGGQYGFQMPLSYNISQGYSYMFFITPAQGIRDLSVSGGGNFGRLDVQFKHHRFIADHGSMVYGRENDLVLGYRISDSITIQGLFTRFRAETGSTVPSVDRHYITLRYEY